MNEALPHEQANGMDGRKLRQFAIHALFLLIIFVLPEALLRVSIPNRTLDISWPMYAKSAITIGVFYLNFFIIIPRTLTAPRPNRWQFFVWNILVVIAGAVAIWIIYQYLYTGPRGPARAATNYSLAATISFIVRDSIVLVLSISLAVALKISSQWLRLEERHQRLTAIRKEAELDSLRQQLNPHFLFNILNSIYALIDISPQRAKKAVHQLSSLLRYMVYENPRTVPLTQEIEFITNFVELMRVRFSNRPITFDVDPVDCSCHIPPLIFLGVVGNAFKHGNTPDQTLPITISITCDGHKVVCTTTNHYVEDSEKTESRGVGLTILRRRIELIFGGRATFDTSKADGVFRTTLTLPVDN